MQLNPIDSAACALRQMTPVQLLYLGTRQVAYLKVGMFEGEQAFLIYGADGVPLEAVDDMEKAIEVVVENGLSFVSVH